MSVHRGGEGLPVPRRRTVASAIVASAHADAAGASPGTDPPQADWSWLRSTSNAGSRGTGSPSLSACLREGHGWRLAAREGLHLKDDRARV